MALGISTVFYMLVSVSASSVLGGKELGAVKNIEQVADSTNFATLLAFASVNVSAFRVFAKNSFTSRLRHIFPNGFLSALGFIRPLLLAASTGWSAALLAALLVVSGLLAYWLMTRVTRKAG